MLPIHNMFKASKIIVRVVTSNYCIPAHLHNTLTRVPFNCKFYVIGDKASLYKKQYPSIIFIDIPLRRNFSLIYDLKSLFSLIYLFIKIKPDIVHSLMTKAGLFTSITAFITRVPKRIHTFTGQVWANDEGFKRFMLKFVDKVICYLNTGCLTDSPSQSIYLFNNGIKHRGTMIPTLLNGSLSGVDLNKFNKDSLMQESIDLKKELGISTSDFVIAYIARKSLDKGCIDMLFIYLDVLKRYRVKLLFIGPDESNGEINKMYAKYPDLKSNIIEYGFVNNHHIFLNISNLLCLPSHREGFGSIVIDAAALGVPSVGYSIPGLSDSISDGYTGRLFDLGDKRGFADFICHLITNPSLLHDYSKNAVKNVTENYNADLLNSELYSYYNKY